MSGDAHSLQNCSGADKVSGGFDSHTPPPFAKLLRDLPSVSAFVLSKQGKSLCSCFGEGLVKLGLRSYFNELRVRIGNGSLKVIPKLDQLEDVLRKRLLRLTSKEGRYAINATGILLHTGLGRSPLCQEALDALQGMGNYSILQTDLESGKRSLREEKIESMLKEITGCEAATVVNNNAAATMLILNTIAEGQEVIISRGQLIEIGGSFRIPDVMAKSSAIMREVGTTNRTHVSDYEKAINENTFALLHVHTSNYRIHGFSGVPDVKKLAALASKHQLTLIDDLGSGALIPLSKYGITDEPMVSESLKSGADIVCFSGDKLICGPQIGIICGKKEIVDRIRKNPFARMFRVCKLTISALEATLTHFVNNTYSESLPFYKMLATKNTTLENRAKLLKKGIASIKDIELQIKDDLSFVGSGSLPDEGISTKVVCLKIKNNTSQIANIDEMAKKLRMGTPSIFCRVKDDSIYFDMRTLFDGEVDLIVNKLNKIFTK